MLALTIWQPWCSLIVVGAKPYEFRGWSAPRSVRGQRIGLHAGARKIKRDEVADLIISLHNEPWTTGLHKDVALPLLERVLLRTDILPLSSIIGTAVLGEPVRADTIAGEFGAPVNDSDRTQHSNWAWPLTDIQPVQPIVPARGAQGFWDWGQGELLDRAGATRGHQLPTGER